jgi:Ala-tRNA(Pro) deacylase
VYSFGSDRSARARSDHATCRRHGEEPVLWAHCVLCAAVVALHASRHPIAAPVAARATRKETAMGIALTMQEYLEDNHVPYDVARHSKTGSSAMTAEASHVPGGSLAKGVVLRWDGSYLLAVVPASRHVDLEKVGALVGERVELASEDEASALFPDCETGAVPILGQPYRVACVVDERLERHGDIWFEGGDHRTLVHVSGDCFGRLMYGVPHGHISD